MEPHDEVCTPRRPFQHPPSPESEGAAMEAFEATRRARARRRRALGSLAVAALVAAAFVGGRWSVDGNGSPDAADVVETMAMIAWAPATSDLTATTARGVPPRN